MNKIAFTLMELIVLVAIVALSAAILIPAVGHAGITPNALVCQASLRVIGLCNAMYANANNDCLPVVRAHYYDPPNEVYSDGMRASVSYFHWFNLLSEYGGHKTELVQSYYPGVSGPPTRCYDYPEVFKGCPDYGFAYGKTPEWCPGYGLVLPIYNATNGTVSITSMNYFDEGGSQYPGTTLPARFHRRSEFAYPAQRGWFAESRDYTASGDMNQTIYDPALGLYPYWDGTPFWGGPSSSNDPGRHGGASNVLFVDGHVELLDETVSGHAFTDYTQLLYPGDFSGDGVVNQGDYTIWADSFGLTGQGRPADANHDGVVDQGDYTVWADHFGEVRP